MQADALVLAVGRRCKRRRRKWQVSDPSK